MIFPSIIERKSNQILLLAPWRILLVAFDDKVSLDKLHLLKLAQKKNCFMNIF